MSTFKIIRGIARLFIKRLPEVRSGSGKGVSKSEQTNKGFAYLGEQHLILGHQLTVCSPISQSSRSLATFARTVFDGIAGKGGHIWTSQAAQLRRRAMVHLLQRSGSRVPLFAFLGFAYAKNTSSPPEHIQEQEKLQELHQWVQKAFRTASSNMKQPVTTENINHQGLKLKDYELTERLGERSSYSTVYAAKHEGSEFAVKMLFNYGVQSHSASLYRAFAKEHQVLSINTTENETAPAGPTSRSAFTNLPAHENIVPVLHTFADDFPFLPDAVDTYPAALPSRYHDGGFGRNRSLFLVMPRYGRTVQQYMDENSDPDPWVSTLLLLQLLEGISHIIRHGIAHRDLKTDNILLDETGPGCPHLVICDFGCCLADRRLGLHLPYATDETDRGGNVQLMAPEVSSVTPGEKTSIDYSKSDAWAAGTIAYELFGETNPFYLPHLDSRTYQEDKIPPLTRAPPSVGKVVSLLLKRNPSERISASEAVFLIHVILCTPPDWLTNGVEPSDVIKWLLERTLDILGDQRTASHMPLERKVLHKFLQQATADDVIEALEFLRDTDDVK